jgi:hypothetical protein
LGEMARNWHLNRARPNSLPNTYLSSQCTREQDELFESA